MGQFATEQEVYEGLGAVLKNAAADDDARTRLKQADAVVQYRVTDPMATITLDARASSDTKVDLGETELEPEIVLSLPADTAQKLFAGELALTEALAAGEIASKGPVAKMLKLLPAIAGIDGAPAAAAADAEPAAEVEAVEEPASEDEALADDAPADEAPAESSVE